MQKQSKIIFHRSGISWFPVPQRLFAGSKSKQNLICTLSAGALRLYLYLLAKSGSEQQPTVEVSNADIANKASVTRNNVVKARRELETHGLIRTIPHTAFVFEILNPTTGNSLPSVLKLARARDYSRQEIEAVFMHYLGTDRLDDNENGMSFVCPFHTIGVNSRSKRRKDPLNVKLSTRGVWQCTDRNCSRYGRRRTEIVENTWHEPVALRVVGGGGDILDFVVAMTAFNDSKRISRTEAADTVEQILVSSS